MNNNYISRLKDEFTELSDKYNKLNAFITSKEFSDVDVTHSMLLLLQRDVMASYSNILKMRLKLIELDELHNKLNNAEPSGDKVAEANTSSPTGGLQ